jgi:glucokinase
VLTGDDGEPPELGAIVLDDAPAAPRTLEDFASAAGFADAYRRHGGSDRPTPPTLFERAANGDRAAVAAIDETARRIAQGLGTLVNALNLNRCLLAGGIAAAGPPLLEPVRRALPAFTWPYLLERTRVEFASTGGDAGLLGAAAFALQAAEAAPPAPGAA